MFARTSILVLSAPLLVGCHSIDVSKLEPFDNYVGCSVLLQRPMALVRESRGMMSRSHLPRLRTSPYVMLDIQESEKSFLHLYPTDTNVTVLPTGHSVTIRTVRNEIVFVDRSLRVCVGRYAEIISCTVGARQRPQAPLSPWSHTRPLVRA
jgi:hypothetical protein